MRHPTLLLAVLLLATACAGGAVGSGGTDGPGDPVGDWVLEVADPVIAVPAGARATLTVEDDGTAGGSTPCNSYGGTATWDDDGSFGLGEVAMTEMGCEPDRMAAQDEYLDALLAATSWALDGDDVLVLTGDGASLTFRRVPPVEAAALVGTDWRLTGIIEGDAVSHAADVPPARLRFDGDTEAGTFTLHTGCRDFAGDWIATADTITLPTWGQADGSPDVAECSEDEVRQETTVLGIVESSFRVSVDGDRLTITSAVDDRLGLTFAVADADEDGAVDDEADPTATTTDEQGVDEET